MNNLKIEDREKNWILIPWSRVLVEQWFFCIVSLLTNLGGAPRIDLPLSCLSSLTISILGSVISRFSIRSKREKKKKTLCKALEKVLHEDRDWSYPRPVFLDEVFWKLSISSSLALETLSNWALTWNSSSSSFLVFSVRKLFSNRNAPMVWLASLTWWEFLPF